MQQQMPSSTAVENFTHTVRVTQKLIKAVHNAQTASRDQPPNTLKKMTHTSSPLIKPVVPTDKTSDLIMGNTKNWTLTTVMIL